MYSYGPPHMAKQKQDDQLEHTYSSYVRIRDVTLKTCQKRWMIGRCGERGSGISVLAVRHDDDDDDDDDDDIYSREWEEEKLHKRNILTHRSRISLQDNIYTREEWYQLKKINTFSVHKSADHNNGNWKLNNEEIDNLWSSRHCYYSQGH